jgi:hypothetical protein
MTLNADGSFTYTPNAGTPIPATDSFTFVAGDGLNTSNPATVTLTVENAPPSPGTAGADGAVYTYAVQPGGSTSWTADAGLLSKATDPHGYSLTLLPDGTNSANGSITNPGDGSFVYTTDHSTLSVNADGSFTDTPDSGFTGTDTFTFAVSDGVYTSAPAAVVIHVDDDELPVPDTGAAYTYAVPPGKILTTSSTDGVLSAASDPYGYSLTAVPDPSVSGASSGSAGAFTYTTGHSTVTINPDGSFAYTPQPGFSGTDTFTYLVSDGLTESAPAAFTIDVNNTEPPTADLGAAHSYTAQPGATLTTTNFKGRVLKLLDLLLPGQKP